MRELLNEHLPGVLLVVGVLGFVGCMTWSMVSESRARERMHADCIAREMQWVEGSCVR